MTTLRIKSTSEEFYSAMWEGRPYEVLTACIGDHSARALDLHNALVVGVSAAGDVAVLTTVRRIRSTNFMEVGSGSQGQLCRQYRGRTGVRTRLLLVHAAVVADGSSASNRRAMSFGTVVRLAERSPMPSWVPVIHIDSEARGGTLVFVGTRVPFRNPFDCLERNHSLDEFLDAFPTVSREQAVADLEAAAEAVTARARVPLDEQLPRQLVRGLNRASR